ncbi:MAG: outer membrane protein insertion porin family [Porticoccaceae bacterium]|jgi:outer membrane protein insertion porin family|tara:strand:- start:10401 stop:12731 length:2331 start_codon:yes stop_codon:yes gene_type:complete
MTRLLNGLFIALSLVSFSISAEVFQVDDIRIEGLQRVSAGTVFAALPVSVGDLIDEPVVREATRSLFRTGYFSDVVMVRENGVLVIGLVERPAVTEINLDGNKAIETEQLIDALRDNGLAEGQIFRQVILEGMVQELQRQYVSQGRYGALVKTEVKELPRNRVAVNIDIDEGDVAKIRHINIVGNSDFTEETLLDEFEQNSTGWLSWISSNDKYAREKLSGDIETLESWYLDRGYLQFAVVSTQVSISPNKESVYITININEGDIFKVSDIELSGELKIPEAQIRAMVLLTEGSTFSQALMTTSKEFIARRLGNEGYTFAEIEGYPELNEEAKTAKITFVVKPGMRAYVRRIEFRGNTKTADNVLRREMRQMEGGSANNALIESSKVMLERLGFFKEVRVENVPVAGTNDLLDVIYTVEEQPSGSVGASVGYSQGYGLILGANLSENNFFGTGKQVGVGLNKSKYQTSINFSYTEPYFTVDGVSVGYSVFARETDYGEYNVSSFSTDTYGASVNWSYPVTDIQRIGFGFTYENLEISSGTYDSKEISEFVTENGTNFDVVSGNVNWVQSTLNRGVFATRGTMQRISADLALPGSGLEYYKITYKAQHLRGLYGPLTLKLRADFGYGESYGGTTTMPFFKNFYGGGFGSVRGFKKNTLGPQDTPPSGLAFYDDPDPIGGNVQVEMGAEVLFPLPFLKDQRSVQSSLFLDVGNIFNTKCGETQVNCFKPDVGELRYSVGLGATWLSGFGPITFSIAKPLNSNDFDETEVFQFSLGNQF